MKYTSGINRTNGEPVVSNNEDKPAPKRRGRPPKAVVEAKKKGNRAVRGRPKGDAAIINEMKARMLASPKSQKVLDSIMNAALDDEHKNQSAAWKLLMDRMLPVSYFEKDKATNGRNSVSITITGVGGETVISGEENTDDADIIDTSLDGNATYTVIDKE